jgi:hypothetical protein
MNTTNTIADVIAMLEDGVLYSDWGAVEQAIKELNFLYEQLDSTFPLDDYENEF